MTRPWPWSSCAHICGMPRSAREAAKTTRSRLGEIRLIERKYSDCVLLLRDRRVKRVFRGGVSSRCVGCNPLPGRGDGSGDLRRTGAGVDWDVSGRYRNPGGCYRDASDIELLGSVPAGRPDWRLGNASFFATTQPHRNVAMSDAVGAVYSRLLSPAKIAMGIAIAKIKSSATRPPRSTQPHRLLFIRLCCNFRTSG